MFQTITGDVLISINHPNLGILKIKDYQETMLLGGDY